MRCWHAIATTLAIVAGVVRASEVEMEQKASEGLRTIQQCAGMYGPKSWGGTVEPFILANFDKASDGTQGDPIVSLLIFEWGDLDKIGKTRSPEMYEREMICDDENINAKLCNETQIGEFILSDDAAANSTSVVFTQAIHLKDTAPIKYSIKRTGYYCIGAYGYSADAYRAVVEFRNAYGELPAAQIAKLPFFGGISVLYAVITAFWAFLYVQHRHDILAVQNYITAILVFLIVEMAMTWGFYDFQNRYGMTAMANVLMIVVAILNAGRNSFTFFLLLIVCMGYGVVKPSLGKTMLYVRGLAIAHFVFGVIYAIASLTVTPDNAGPLVLLVILPLAGTLTAFYVWTLNALGATMKDLVDRKQTVKAMMYRKLWWCIFGSICVIFAFFFLNSVTFAGRSDPNFVPRHWKRRWFVLDGWLNIVYMLDLAYVAYVWRPTANNRRFAMSDELAQDDEGFEIASFGGSLDEDEEEGVGRRADGAGGEPAPRATTNDGASPPTKPRTAATSANDVARDSRPSLEGETLFAVGDGEEVDKWSDEGSPRNSGERTRLTAKDAEQGPTDYDVSRN